eukprot:TRINITY_DN54808_c0_g1_i1.p1 TRINITY_DN54808_c0_g1~~TRINITY_DN54808_c0_g1_i1.p1  ORF type:complete len:235 (+),score=20.54 TRINITY_DN54808_c0_g1_i1:86-790(+)
MRKIVLVGDSVFDNKTYVKKGAVTDNYTHPELGSSVIEHLQEREENSVLCAEDGAIISQVREQLPHIPTDATHVFVSCGGNDLLIQQGTVMSQILQGTDKDIAVANLGAELSNKYLQLFEELKLLNRPTAVCFIYNPCYTKSQANPNPRVVTEQTLLQQWAPEVIKQVNQSVILPLAQQFKFAVLDLQTLFNDASCYANPIEPSVEGGRRIAELVHKVVQVHDFGGETVTYGEI